MSNCQCEQNSEILQQEVVDQTCPRTGFQQASVCVPVRVTPFANAMPTTTFCCGPATVAPGSTTCAGTVNGSCTFTITQNVCIAVPVVFGATARVGAPSVVCGEATSTDVCTNCGA